MPLAMAAIARWEHLEEELDADIHYYREGHIKLYEREEDVPAAHQTVADQRTLGLDISVVEGKDLHELVPGIAPHIVAGTYTANDGHANPTLTTAAFAKAAQKEGATLRSGVKITGITQSGGRITRVMTSEGPIEADHVILATGAWTRDLVAPLGVDLPIFPTGLQMILTKRMPKMLRQVVGAYQRPLSLKQLRDGNYLIGGGWPGDVDMISGVGKTREESIKGSLDTASSIVPILKKAGVERSWVGVEGICADEVPIIGSIQGYDGLTVAGGVAGAGGAPSPITGQLVSELVLDGQPSISLEEFSATRFAGKTDIAMPSPSAG
jgi:sarcosine oxidase subunit beta